MTTFRGRCGCPLGTAGHGSSSACRLAHNPVSWCSVMATGRTLPRDDDGRMMRWAGVEPGDLVRAPGGSWWEVMTHGLYITPGGTGMSTVEVVSARGIGDAVLWAKTVPTPWEVAHGWRALDPQVRVWVVPWRDHRRGTTDPLTLEQAAERIASWLGGVEIIE